MTRFLTLAGLALASLYGAQASAQVLDDPLHGYCSGAGQCVDNKTNSPSSGTPTDFGFTISPASSGTGDLLLDILVPDNESHPASFSVTGTLPGTATLFSSTPWTSNQLDAYLGISASPTNPIGAFLPSTVALDAGATGFYVYQANLGTTSLYGPSNPNVAPLDGLGASLPLASYIVGFLNEGTAQSPDWIATANSGAIFDTGTGGGGNNGGGGGSLPTPEPASIALLGVALAGLGAIRKRRRD